MDRGGSGIHEKIKNTNDPTNAGLGIKCLVTDRALPTPRSLPRGRKVDDADRMEGGKFFSSVIATERARSGQLDEAVNGNGCVTISQYVADDVMPSSCGGTAVDALSNANENENFRITECKIHQLLIFYENFQRFFLFNFLFLVYFCCILY